MRMTLTFHIGPFTVSVVIRPTHEKTATLASDGFFGLSDYLMITHNIKLS